MNTYPSWKDLIRELKVFTVWIFSSLIDAIFLALWVLVQWLVNGNVIVRFGLSGIDRWMLFAFQVLFAISTLAPVVIYIYADTSVMFWQAQMRIWREKDKYEKKSNDLAKTKRQ